MKKATCLMAAAVALAIGSGIASGQRHSSGGGRDGASGGWHGGGGGRAGAPGDWRGGGTARDGWHAGGNRGNWNGGGRHGGWYAGGHGPRVGIYRGGPRVWGGWPYPIYRPYSIYAAPPYPIYVDPGPTVYVERYPYPVYAQPSPPAYIEPPRIADDPAPAPTPMPAPPQERFERFTLSARELFEFDRAALRMPQPKLDEIAVVLIRNPQINRVIISGYTDRIGTDSYNLKLSQRRADAVKNYLVGKGVAAIRLTAIGKGKANPVVECRETARPALIKCLEPNRRVEVEQITVERRIR